jgi:dTDP-4-dehydrorhamnose reductase
MRVAILGALGQLGSDLVRAFQNRSDEVIPLDMNDVDISKEFQVSKVIDNIRPEMIVNTAAYHNVEKCQENLVRAFAVNSIGARNLAMLSLKYDIFLIHISTDYVFDGLKRRPYIEKDRPVPINVYGNTKLSGEHFVESIANRYLIMRTSGLYGENPCREKGGMNFVDLMIHLAQNRDQVRVVDNEILTPTSTVELTRQIIKIADNELNGLCHATAEGFCSWYDFAKEIFRLMHIETPLHVASPHEFPQKVPRPNFSVLENKILKDKKLNVFKPWQEALEEYLRVKHGV